MKVEIPKVIKFQNGDLVIALVDDTVQFLSDSHIEILYPIKVMTDLHTTGDRVVERFSLQPWIALTDSTHMTISTSNISALVDLRDDYEEGYKRMVENIYFNTEEVILEEDDNEMDLTMEYYEAKKQGKIN